MKYYIFLLLIIFASCSKPKKDATTPIKLKTETIKYGIPQILSIKGDFDGDGKEDILRQFLADSTGRQVTKIQEQDTWEETVTYFSKQGYYTAILMNNKFSNPIKFDNSQGLYCLINIGDLNNDKRDEIALVPDLMDFSRANNCRIYSLCSSGWKELFIFNVHEDAFDYTAEEPPLFTNIPGALEFRNNQWHFYDFLEMDYKTAEEVGQMKKLIVVKCL